jgi:hypothetical protein
MLQRPSCFLNSSLHTNVPHLTKVVLLFLLGFELQCGSPLELALWFRQMVEDRFNPQASLALAELMGL